MRQIKKWVNNIYLQEIAIFIAMFILTMLHEWVLIEDFWSFFKGLCFFTILYIQAQINRFFIFPFFLKNQLHTYIFYTFIVTLIGASVLLLNNYYLFDPQYYQNANIIVSFIYQFIICIIATFTIMSLSLMQRYNLEVQKRNIKKIELNEVTLKFLSAQLNPHFFFNTLNNLYGVSLAEPDRAPDLILKISKLMRYQLESVDKTMVKLEDEISFIKNYIDLEKERIGKRCKIVFKYPKNLKELYQYNIAPLMIIILIENAFKHSITKNNWFVNINIQVEDNQLKINIENSLPDKAFKKSTGIGLKNVTQRLNFLYKGNYEISCSQNNFIYQTKLILQLKSY